MLLVQNGEAYFIDRKFDFYLIQKFQWLAETLSEKGGTLLDGEMIRHEDTKQAIFLLFDVIQLKGVFVGNETLTKRLAEIANVVLMFRDFKKQEVATPFALLGKTFYPSKHIRILVDCIYEKDGHRYYKDKEGKRHHKTDGIIFTPDTHYELRTCSDLFKWKYLDLFSIDLRTTFRNGAFYFTCQGAHNEEIPYIISLKLEDQNQLKKFDKIHTEEGLIVEYSYDQGFGSWTFKQVRPDKNKPNYVTIVFDTLESIAENVTFEEISYRVPLPPQNDQWVQLMQKKVNDLIRQNSN